MRQMDDDRSVAVGRRIGWRSGVAQTTTGASETGWHAPVLISIHTNANLTAAGDRSAWSVWSVRDDQSCGVSWAEKAPETEVG